MKRFLVLPISLLAVPAVLRADPIPVVITVDDGLKTGLTIMAPAFEKRGWRGTYNIVTDSIGKPACLTWDDVRELVRRGHSVTTHTKSHANLGKLAQVGKTDVLRTEIAVSADRIERETGVRPHYLCLPWGVGGPEVDRIAASCGLETFAVRREVCGKCSPAGTDRGPKAVIGRRIAEGARAVDLMIHGVTPAGGGYEAFETVSDFESFLDEVAACTNAVVTDYRTAQNALGRKIVSQQSGGAGR